MCDPVSALAISSVATAGVTVASTLASGKARKSAAKKAKEAAAEEKQQQDLDTLDARRDDYNARRKASGATGGSGLFSPRSFFSAS